LVTPDNEGYNLGITTIFFFEEIAVILFTTVLFVKLQSITGPNLMSKKFAIRERDEHCVP